MVIEKYIDSQFNSMLDSLNRLVSIPSIGRSPEGDAPFGKSALEALNEVIAISSEMGLHAENYHNRLAIIDLYKDKNPTIGILAHADVVPEGNGWTYDPFKATLDGDKIFGRGTIDNKGSVISALYAMKYIKEHSPQVKNNIRLIVGSDEERGSSDLAYYREREKLPEYVFTPDANYPVINTEKGRIAASFIKKMSSSSGKKILLANGGTVVNAVPDRAYASVQGYSLNELNEAASNSPKLKYEFTPSDNGIIHICVIGRSAHASLPEGGENAITALCEFLSKLDTNWTAVTKICPHGDIHGKKAGIACSDEISGNLTFAFDILNFDGEKFSGTLDIRFPVCTDVKTLESKLRTAFASENFDLTVLSSCEPHHTSKDSLLVKALLDVYEEITGKKGEALAVGGGTYAHGIPGAVAFGPEFPGEDNHMHAEDEFISVHNFKLNCKMMIRALQLLDSRIV